ncbi:hypothetical protein B0H14DRAFT_3152889 [Mycena olivaceomarginata]|nr:hypothetical protein B0H14DRAFT_3152889 [Mycena olivaceomarginata]
MGFPDRVPNELWGEILGNVNEYDRPTFQNFSLTCRAFLPVSRPFLFSTIRLTPYRIGNDGDLLLPPPAEVDRRLKRLEFWCSSEIAPLVRSCLIRPLDSYTGRDASKWSSSTDTPYILLDSLFRRLDHFTGLQRLHASGIHFTQARVDILSHLPRLFELHLSDCAVAPGEHIETSPHVLRMSDFSLCHDSKSDPADDYWFPLLQPDQLRVLRSDFALGRTIYTISSFPNVQTLEAIMHRQTPSQYSTALSKFPAVRILKLWGKGLHTDVVVPDAVAVFPVLEEYYGPHEALPPNVLAQRIWSTRIQGRHGRNITSFNVGLKTLNVTIFNKIVEHLPQLTELLITCGVSNLENMFTRVAYDPREVPKDAVVDGRFGDEVRMGFKPSTFFLKLADVPFLPPALERLAISWDCYDQESYLELSAYMMRDALVARCPGLNWLWLNGIYFRFEWRDPMPDGTVKEFIAKKFHGCICAMGGNLL